MITKTQALTNIRKSCEDRINKIYCAGVPAVVRERLEHELKFLENSESIFSYEIFRIVCNTAKRINAPVIASNGSFISYLLNYMGINPLPAHYYCDKCGKIECTNNYNIMGIDLPQKQCSCGEKMKSMGIGIPFECQWGTEKNPKTTQDITVRSVKELMPYANTALGKVFGDERVIAIGHTYMNEDGTPSIYCSFGGFAILNEKDNKADLEDEFNWLEDCEPCIGRNYIHQNNLLHIDILPVNLLEAVYESQKQIGLFASDINHDRLAEIDCKALLKMGKAVGEYKIIKELMPDTKAGISRVMSAAHSTIEFEGEANIYPETLVKYMKSDIFRKYPFIEREDFFTFMLDMGADSELAYTIFEYLRTGRHNRNPNEFRKLLENINVEEDFFEAVSHYRYLFPRYHNAAYLYFYLILTEYAHIDRKAVAKILNRIYS